MGVDTSATDELLSQPVSLAELRDALNEGDVIGGMSAVARGNVERFLQVSLLEVVWSRVAPAIGMIHDEVQGHLRLADAALVITAVFRHTDERMQRWLRAAAPEVISNLCTQAVEALVRNHRDRALAIALRYDPDIGADDAHLRCAVAEHTAGDLYERVSTMMGYSLEELAE